MVEAGANEIPEAEILDALDIAHDAIKKLCAAQRELAEKVGKEKMRVRGAAGRRGPARARSAPRTAQQLDEATQVEDKLERQDATKAVEAAVLEQYSGDPDAETLRRAARAARSSRSTSSRRRSSASASPSTRSAPTAARENEIRPITIEVGVAPRTHGSALFTRGQTQALSVAALGTLKEEMRLDTLGLETQEVLLAPLQLPAVLGGRGRLHARPQAPRHRPRRARRARAGAGGPVDRGLPVHDPRRLGHPRVQRLVVDGLGLRLVAVADGRGRADQARRSPASRWA